MLRLYSRAPRTLRLAVRARDNVLLTGYHGRCHSRVVSQAEKSARAAQERAASRRGQNISAISKRDVPGIHVSPISDVTTPIAVASPQRTLDHLRTSEVSHDVANDAGKQPVVVKGSELMLSPPALVVTREYEWGNIVFGFEQANRYTIRAAPGGEVVGYIAEEDSIGKSVARNVLRTHRSFKATILDKNGEAVFVIRRPFYVVSTNLFVDEPGENAKNLGQVEMSWHLWRRRYSLYADGEQFAEVDTGFLGVDFNMMDERGRRIASVNKDFTGFAREIFTDARQYVLRLDPSYNVSAQGLVNDTSTLAAGDHVTGNEKDARQLTLSQRAVILAAAVSIDFDYFSLHSRGGLGPGGMFMPMPIPGGTETGGGSGNAGAGGAEGTDVPGGGLPGTGSVAGSTAGSDSAQTHESGIDGSGFPDNGFSSGTTADDSQWATFEEPDYGFQPDAGSSDGGSDDFGSGISGESSTDFGDSGDGEGNPIISLLKSLFSWDD